MEKVLDSTRAVVQGSQLVSIDPEGVMGFSNRLSRKEIQVPPWDSRYHLVDGGPTTVAYMLVLDSLNFCFWPPPCEPRWTVRYGGEELSGYYALAAALTRAVESGAPILSAAYLAEMSRSDLEKVLEGKGKPQLMEERFQILRELGKVLKTRYGGQAYRLVESASGSAVKLTQLLAKMFPSFRDAGSYRGRQVFFYKRAQILAADLHGVFSGKSWGRFHDLEMLTAFADYKLPQVLRHLGVLRYSPSLSEKVDRYQLIPAGSPEELEIRANTIWAVERIRGELFRQGIQRTAVEIDRTLWHLGQENRFREKPYHRTMTIYY
jgi:hypothetical protein